MVCYIMPTVAAMVCYLLRQRSAEWHDTRYLWLNLLLLGGAMFGVVDHLWNGELFLIGENIFWDLSLGFTITAAIVVAWAVIVLSDRNLAKSADKVQAGSSE